MEIQHHEYKDVPQLSYKDQAYIGLEPYLADFYVYEPSLEAFAEVMAQKRKQPIDRELLSEVLTEEYSKVQATDVQLRQIQALKDEQTFTVTTAHQPSLLGGPLYYILKICSAIHLARRLNIAYPDQHIVPLFINGSEDHDFDEIDHLHLFGKEIKWDRTAKGPVGRLSVEGLDEVLAATKEILGHNPNAEALIAMFEEALRQSSNYNQFVFRWVHALFAKTELIILNMDHHKLKKSFVPVLEKELIERPSQALILETQELLSEHGFKAQAYPRDINLFYLGTGDRLRITYEGGRYHMVDTDLSYSEAEIKAMLHERPEDFSPNVVIRPLYQEYVLPNLAYIGGGGEIAYWLERRTQFEHFGLPFPMLLRRNSAVIINKGLAKQAEAMSFSPAALFADTDALINAYLHSQVDSDITIDDELGMIETAYKSIAAKAAPHDPSLEKSILAEMTRQLKSAENLGGRIKRAVKAKEETNVNKIRKVREKLFPNDGLQERHDNFMQYYIASGPALIDFLIDHLDPLDRRFAIIMT